MRSGHPGQPAWWRPWPLPRLVVTLAAVGLVAWEGTLSRTSAAARSSVGVVIAIALLTAVGGGRNRQRGGSGAWARDGARALSSTLFGRATRRAARATVLGAAVWVALIAAAIGWDLYSFAVQLHAFPTLSRLFGDVTRHEWGRSVVFAGWLLLGGYVALGWRRPLGRRGGPHDAGSGSR